jgi:hypothetical protein
MIICDKCPILIKGETGLFKYCAISGHGIMSGNNYISTEKFCPLIKIELKDGAVFVPEVYNEKN